MMAELKAEFRKLLTVRSTYILAAGALALLGFVSAYIAGYREGRASLAGPGASLFLAGSIVRTSTLLSIFGAIVGLLLMTHEYRYNTIMYTLTAINRRSKVLVAKITAVITYVLVLVLLGMAVGLGGMILGVHFAGLSLPHQDISLATYFIKTLCYCEGWALASLLLAALLRNQVAALAVLFIAPNTIEGLLSLLLKQNSVYMPFMALSQVIAPPVLKGAVSTQAALGELSPAKGGLVFSAYLAVGWTAAWILFLRRDAN